MKPAAKTVFPCFRSLWSPMKLIFSKYTICFWRTPITGYQEDTDKPKPNMNLLKKKNILLSYRVIIHWRQTELTDFWILVKMKWWRSANLNSICNFIFVRSWLFADRCNKKQVSCENERQLEMRMVVSNTSQRFRIRAVNNRLTAPLIPIY